LWDQVLVDIVDAHLDLAFNAVSVERDLLLPLEEIRGREKAAGDKRERATACIPELIRGNVKIVFGSLWANPCKSWMKVEGKCYSNQDEAHAQAMEQLRYYERLESGGFVSIIRTRRDLDALIRQTDGEKISPSRKRVGLVLSMEGADPIRNPREMTYWFEKGLRIVGPAWGETKYSGGTGSPGPLKPEGRILLEQMESIGVILDGAHMAEESFFEALDRFRGTFIVSHANCRVFVPTDRQLSDEMIRATSARGGVIGTVFYNKFLKANWKREAGSKDDVKLSHVARNMSHVRAVSGDSSHVGIGSDLDGGFGFESTPLEIESIADLQKLPNELEVNGFSRDEIEGIMGRNWLRILEKALSKG
jgi:membrane dipeptidase